MTANPPIVCEGLVKTYGGSGPGRRAVHALRGVDLTIDRPGFYAIMGRSGSGKSTMLHLLAALDKPDSGSILVGGRDVHTLDEAAATVYRRRVIGVVFQSFNLIPTLTALENASLPGALAGEPEDASNERAMDLLTRLGLSDRASHRPGALSGGEQQRVAIARALHFSPSVVLADEPTGALDSASSRALWDLLRDVAAEHETTVVMVTHEPEAAAQCARVYVLADGRVVGDLEGSTDGRSADAGELAARVQRLAGEAE